MAQEVRIFHVTVPVGTAKASPQITDLSFPSRIVTELEIVVPPGPRGEVGFAIGAAGTRVLPINAGTFIVTDDESLRWPLEGFWDSGSWQMAIYNTGNYPHTIEVRFLVDIPQETPAALPTVISGGLAVGTTGVAAA